MSPEVGKMAFVLASFLILGSIGSLVVVPAGSAEYFLSLATIGIGLALYGLIALFARLSR